MKFTGERYIPAEQGRIRLEHYHRYAIVGDLVKGKDVLDVACGEGYGSSIMAGLAHSVVGVDISEQTVQHASSSYRQTNLTFCQGSAAKLNFADSSFDVVVSFETIEHLLEQTQMLAEIKRVLRTDGFLVISSPNRPIYSEESGEHNEFHVKELDFKEFDELLKVQFPAIRFYGQRMLMGSVIQPLKGGQPSFRAWHDDGHDLKPKAGTLVDPVYFVAVCGSKMVDLPKIDMSVLYPDKLDLVKHYEGFARWAQSIEHTISEQDNQISMLRDKISKFTEQETKIAQLESEIVNREEWAMNLDHELKKAQTQLTQITMSSSWQITKPLREMRRIMAKSLQLEKRVIKSGMRTAKRMYQSLPLSYQTKAAHRNLLARYFPDLLLISDGHELSIPNLTLPGSFDIQKLSTETIVFPVSDNPLVSIIIPVYGEIEYTLRCLASIVANPPKTSFEVIVVDDCSPDNSVEVLSKINTIRLIENKENQGFIHSCNNGSNVANGEYICFLNNDTEVTIGWIDELVRTFKEFPGTGLVGSKLIYPDGRLQEAGGIVWQDGSAWNFGRFQDPLLPEYNYAREVDYCSGASIMVSKSLFDELQGFDERYVPAYCEDCDLALKIREKGYRVIYQPLSTIIHYEGVTSGTDTSQGTKAYQIENTKKLYERWNLRLQEHQPPGMYVDKAKDRRATRRVLVIDHCTPTPNQDAGSVIVFNLLLLLREMGFQVTFLPEDNFMYMPEYTTALQRVGIEVLYAPYVTSVGQHLKQCDDRYDLAFLFRPVVIGRHLKAIRKLCPKAKVLYHVVDLHFLRMSREAELYSDKAGQKSADEMKQRELVAIRASDASIVPSTVELELLTPELPDSKLYVLPLILDVHGTSKSFNERRDIVFVGGYRHQPNLDAVKYFVDEIMPLLRKQLPGVRLFVVGSEPPVEIQNYACEDIIIMGFVEELTPLLDKMRVSVAPLRYGAGIKGKIGTALAAGLPVVATSVAVEGMSLTDGENILVADVAEDFADAIAKLYQNNELWDQIQRNGLKVARKAWGIDAAWDILSEILGAIGIKTTKGKYPLSIYIEEDPEKKAVPDNNHILKPIASVANSNQLVTVLQGDLIEKIVEVENRLIISSEAEVFTVNGFCVPCNKEVPFLVDMQSGGQHTKNGWLPNWRERMVCPNCQMNNRQRLIAALIIQALGQGSRKNVYFMEQVTPIFAWAEKTFKNHNIVGSEYLGHEYEGGTSIKGIRHEDVENLSFQDNHFDLIVSNDVFEHVPDPSRAFAECARVLKKDGQMIATIPFHQDQDESITRAKIVDGNLEQLLPPQFHGNPVSAEGSLVFTDFGWMILDQMKNAGFSNALIDVFASVKLGHLGGGQLVFRSDKTPDVVNGVDDQQVNEIQANTGPEKSSALVAILGEVLWHSLTVDPTIEEVSKQHLETITAIIKKKYKKPRSKRSVRLLEVAAYAHTTGYQFAEKMGAEVVLTDISVDTLALGKKFAKTGSSSPSVRRVAADFHDLPFDEGQFDMVFIASALHHTWNWQTVLNEMIRVLAPGGLLYLENEPCLRELCFYKFRTNRPEQFRPLEKELKESGLIYTIAEPYVGSHPEELFGMVENQTIPLNELLSILSNAGEVVDKSLLPESCMGKFEYKLIALRSKDKETVRLFIEQTLKSGVQAASSLLGDGERAMGCQLPTDSEIEKMAEKISTRVVGMAKKTSSDAFRMQLSNMFGAEVSLLVRKNGVIPEKLNPLKLRYDWGLRNDVTIGYPEATEKVLNLVEDVLPNIQTSSDTELREVYPIEDWDITEGDNAIRVLTPIVNGSRILCRVVSDARKLQILIRVYVAFSGIPYRLHLSLDGLKLATFDVYQVDSFLFSPKAALQNSNFEITFTSTPVDSGELTVSPQFNISAVRLCVFS